MKKDYLYDLKDEFYLSYSKICGRKIKDIIGYISNEPGEPTFKISQIIFEDDYKQYVEGEHDFPYITDYDNKTYKIIEEINDEENKEDKII